MKETNDHTDQLMESLLTKARGMVEELIDFKSTFAKCDDIRGQANLNTGGKLECVEE